MRVERSDIIGPSILVSPLVGLYVVQNVSCDVTLGQHIRNMCAHEDASFCCAMALIRGSHGHVLA